MISNKSSAAAMNAPGNLSQGNTTGKRLNRDPMLEKFNNAV